MDEQHLPKVEIDAFITKEGDLNIKILQTEKQYNKFGSKLKDKKVYVEFITDSDLEEGIDAPIPGENDGNKIQ